MVVSNAVTRASRIGGENCGAHATDWTVAGQASYAGSRMPPGRPRDFDTDHALDAAMRLFWHRGYRATRTRDLVRSLGLGQSSITSAFGTKADLADAALARYL